MFGQFTEEARKILVGAKLEMTELKHPYVGSEHLLLAILKSKNNVSKKLKQYNLDYDKFKNKIIETVGVGSKESEWFLYTPLLKRVMENAMLDCKEDNSEVTIESLFSNLLEEGEGVAIRILISLNVDLDSLYNEFSYKIFKKKKNKKLLLEELGTDLTSKANELDPVIGRDSEIRRIIEVLSRRTKNNPLLIGEAGVGKTAIVEELSKMIANGDVPNNLKNKRIINLDMATMVAGTKYRGEFEERVTKMLKEIENDDTIILFIDEIHTLMGAGGAEGAIDAANIFKPALARGKLQLIGATTIDEYKQSIEKDKAIERRFQVVVVEEPQSDKVYDILVKLKPLYEKFHHVKISDEGLRFIIQLTDKYMHDRRQPDKAIDVLDEVCAKVSLVADKDSKILHKYQEKLTELVDKKNKYILQEDFEKAGALKTEEKELSSSINTIELRRMKARGIRRVKLEDIADVVSIKAKVPIYEIHSASLKFLRQLEKQLKQKIYGQDQAVMQLVNFTKKMQLGYKDGIHPTSFLFVGPTGVGKTMLAKEYSRLLFGEDRLIRLDMSEYREAGSITKIIGSAPGYVGYDDGKNKLEEIKNKPHAVILVDEIEKAHPSVLNLFLQILDEGRITDAKGNTVHLEHNIIIMTSNIGFSAGDLGFVSTTTVENKLQDFLSLELLNRIDQVIQFNRLTHEAIRQVVRIQMRELKEKFKAKEIKIQFTDSLVEEIIGASEYEKFGARRVSKIIEDKIDNYIIDQILLGMNSIKIEEINL